MSKSIDQKIVEMQFDNKNFEKNAAESMGTIDKLKQKLDFSDEGKSFQDLEKASGKVSFSGLKNGIDDVKLKFSALEVAGITALTNLTNKAVDAGVQFVKSLSLDQVTAGFDKFGEKTTNVATLVSQGYDLDVVNEQMERLNWFTDETSYEFTEMVKNIAKFTATGQGLEDSVTAMEGIASWAALSGQNARTASSAMYQLSQAMGAGAMRREDYKSIQNVSMDTDEFRQHALDAAVALGTLRKNADDTYTAIGELAKKNVTFTKQQFTEGLTEGMWFTKDVMMKVFNEYSSAVNDIYEISQETGMTASEVMEEFGDQFDAFGLKAFRAGQEARTFRDAVDSIKDAVSTGFMNTFEIIFGDYEEAKTLWTDLANNAYDVFAEPVNQFNEKLNSALNTNMFDLGTMKEWSEMYLDSKTDVAKNVSTILSDFDHYLAQTLGKKLEYKTTSYDISQERLQFVADKAGVAKESIEKLYEYVNKNGLDSSEVQEYINTLANGNESLVKYLNTTIQRSGELISKTRTGTNVESILDYAKKVGKDSEEFDNYLKEYVTTDEELQNEIKEFVSVYDSGYTSDAQVMYVLADSVGTTREEIEKLYSLVNEKGIDDESVKEFINTLSNGDEEIAKFTRDYVESTTTIAKTTTGRQNLIEAFWTLWDGIADIGERIKKAFTNIFPESQWSSIYAWTVKLKDGIKAILPNEEQLDKIQHFFEGIFTIFKGIGEVLKTIFKPFKDMLANLFKRPEGEGGILDALGEWGEKISSGFEDFKNGGLIKTISDVSNWIADKLGWLLSTVGRLLSFIKNSISNFFNADVNISNDDGTSRTITRLEWFQEKLQAIGSWINDKFTFIKDTIVKFFTDKNITIIDEEGIEKEVSKLDWIKDKFDKFVEWIKSTWETVKGFFKEIKASIKSSGIGDTISNFFAQIKEAIAGIFTKKKPAEKLDTEEEADVLDPEPIVQYAEKVKSFFEILKEKITPIWEKIKPLWDILKRILGLLWDTVIAVLDYISRMSPSELLAAAGLTGGAVVSLKTFKNVNSLIEFVKGFADSLTQMVNSFKQMSTGVNQLLKDKGLSLKLTAIATLLKGIGLALVEIAAAMYIVSLIDEDKMAASIATVSGILLAVSTLVVILSKTNKSTSSFLKSGKLISMSSDSASGNLKAMAILMIAIGAALLEIAKAMKTIAEIGDGWKIAEAGAAVTLIMEAMVLIIKQMNQQDVDLSAGVGIAIEMIGLCLVLKRVVKTVKALADMKPEEMAQGIIGLAAVLGIIGGIMFIPIDEKRAKAFGFAMIEIAVAMWAFGKYMKDIAELNWEDIGKAVAVFAVVAGGLAGIMFIPFDAKKALAFGAAMDLISVAMLLLLPVIRAFSEMSMDEYWQALGAIAIISAIIAALSAVMSVVGVGVLAGGAGIALLGLGILELVGALAILAEIAPKLAESAPLIANAIVEIVSTMVSALPTIIGDFAQAVITMAPLVGEMLITLLKTGLAVLAESIVEIATTVVNLLIQILDVVKSNIGPITDKLIGIFIEVMNASIGRAAEVVQALVGLLQAIFGALGEALGDDLDLAKVLEGVAIVAALLVAMTAITIMAAEALATMALLNQVADQLNIFMLKIQPFIIACKTIDPESMEGAKLLAETILLLTATSILDALTSWFTGGVDYVKFAEALNQMAPAIKSFADQMANVDGENLEQAAHAALYLAEFANNLPKEGGWAQFFTGETMDMSKFAKGLADLAPQIVAFAEEGMKITEAHVKAIDVSTKAVKKLADMANSLPRTGGVLQDLIGEVKSLTDFGEELGNLAPKLVFYAEEIRKLQPHDFELIEKSTAAVGGLVAIANMMPREGGWWQSIAGEAKSLTDFAVELVDLGAGIQQYSAKISVLSDADIDHINKSVGAVAGLVAVNNALRPENGELVKLFVGDQDFASFPTDVEHLGDGLVKYANKVADIDDIDSVLKSVQVAGALVNISNSLENNGSPIINFFTGQQNLETFGKNVESFGTSLSKYAKTVAGITVESLSGSVQATEDIVAIMTSLKDSQGNINANAIRDFGNAFVDYGNKLKTFQTNMDSVDSAKLQTALDNTKKVINNLNIPQVDQLNQKDLPGLGLKLSGFADNVKHFADDMVPFSTDFKTFIDTMADIPDSKVDNAVEDLDEFITEISKIPEYDVDKLERFGTALANLAEEGVTKFIAGVTGSYAKIKTSGEELINNFIDGAKSKIDSLKTAGQELSDALITKFTSLTVDYEEAGEAMVLDIANGINKARQQSENLNPIGTYATDLQTTFTTAINDINFYTVGEAVITTFCTAVSEGGQFVSASFGSTEEGLIQGVADIKTYYTSFYDAGYYLVDGFKQGIDERSKAIEESASNLGGKAFAALKSALKEHSPSKLTYQVGQYFTQGFAEGIAADVYYVERSINYISDQAAEEMSNIISNLGNQLDDDIDDHLTITPVLDLTEFQAGTKVMDDYFSQMSRSRVGATAAYDSMANRATPQSMHDAMMNKLDSLEPSAAGESINNNNFYIQSNDPREVATEVSRILQKQVERRNSVWE